MIDLSAFPSHDALSIPNSMKNKTVLSLALSIAAAVLTQPLFASVSPDHDIQITENSSTSLSATFDGVPVTVQNIQNTAPDRWTITFSDTFTFGSFALNGWIENPPSNTGLGNIVEGDATNQLFVLSDIAIGSVPFPNGSQFVENLFISGSQTTVGIRFFDNGDGARVPDSGSTSGLLLLSLIALVAVSRGRSALV